MEGNGLLRTYGVEQLCQRGNNIQQANENCPVKGWIQSIDSALQLGYRHTLIIIKSWPSVSK